MRVVGFPVGGRKERVICDEVVPAGRQTWRRWEWEEGSGRVSLDWCYTRVVLGATIIKAALGE